MVSGGILVSTAIRREGVLYRSKGTGGSCFDVLLLPDAER